jgi:hypothetical protein
VTMRLRTEASDSDGGAHYDVMETDTVVRCRKCEACRRYRRAVWAERIVQENLQADRSWFVTLTINPATRYAMQLRAETRETADGRNFRHMTPGEKTSAIFWEIGAEVTAWLKRVRSRATKRAKLRGQTIPRLRYVLVFEEGSENGREHVHLIVHEAQGRVLEEELRTAWAGIGFAEAKLTRNAEASGRYAAKYLVKGTQVRIRASLHYGAWRTANPPASPHSTPRSGGVRDRIDPPPSFPPPPERGVPAGFTTGGGPAVAVVERNLEGDEPSRSNSELRKEEGVTDLGANPTSGNRHTASPSGHLSRVSRAHLRLIDGGIGKHSPARTKGSAGGDRTPQHGADPPN